jgi:hypothetical protein
MFSSALSGSGIRLFLFFSLDTDDGEPLTNLGCSLVVHCNIQMNRPSLVAHAISHRGRCTSTGPAFASRHNLSTGESIKTV